MDLLKVYIITPRKKVWDGEVRSITLPAEDGEITILPNHVSLFSTLKEGIVKLSLKSGDDYYAIGGGYVETDGKEVSVLVSRAYGEDDVTEQMIRESEKRAEKILRETKDKGERVKAYSLLRKSSIDKRLLKKRRHRRS